MKKILTFLVFILGTAFCTGFMVYQLLNMIEPDTGFYYTQYINAYIGLTIVLVAALMAVLLVGSLLQHDVAQQGKTSKIVGVFAILISIDGFYSTIKTATATSNAAKEQIIASTDWKRIVLMTAFLVFSVFMLLFGVFQLIGKKIPSGLCVIPVLFAGVRLAVVFLGYFGLSKTTDIVLETVMLLFSMIFWHLFGKCAAGIKYEPSSKLIIGFGLCAALMCFVCTLPYYGIRLFMPGTAIRSIAQNMCFDLGTGVFIVSYILSLMNKKAVIANADKRVISDGKQNGSIQ